MTRLRALLACLLLVAIPLQGLAAASMLYCGTAAGHQVAEATGHDHAAHDGAGHGHAGHDEAQPAAGAQPGDPAMPAAGHACSACAACSHSVAISQTPQVAPTAPAPRGISAEPLVRVHDLPNPVPDKPPRA